MDKTSVQILKYLKKQAKAVSKESIVERFGECALASVEYLLDLGYIEETKSLYAGRTVGGDLTQKRANGKYRLKGAGLVYLECRISNSVDQWFTRIMALIGTITGIIALFT